MRVWTVCRLFCEQKLYTMHKFVYGVFLLNGRLGDVQNVHLYTDDFDALPAGTYARARSRSESAWSVHPKTFLFWTPTFFSRHIFMRNIRANISTRLFRLNSSLCFLCSDQFALFNLPPLRSLRIVGFPCPPIVGFPCFPGNNWLNRRSHDRSHSRRRTIQLPVHRDIRPSPRVQPPKMPVHLIVGFSQFHSSSFNNLTHRNLRMIPQNHLKYRPP
jgi:hypothetical protein